METELTGKVKVVAHMSGFGGHFFEVKQEILSQRDQELGLCPRFEVAVFKHGKIIDRVRGGRDYDGYGPTLQRVVDHYLREN